MGYSISKKQTGLSTINGSCNFAAKIRDESYRWDLMIL